MLADSILGTIVTAFYAQAPLQTCKVHRTSAPWLSHSLKLRIRHRNPLFARAVYRQYRDELRIDIRLAHDGYHLRRLSEINDVARLWRVLASFGPVRPAPSSPLIFFSPDELN